MVDILIRNVSPRTRERLRRNARKRGESLQAYLRNTLEQLATQKRADWLTNVGFGTWLAAISRPGADLTEQLNLLRSAPLRRLDLIDDP